VTPRISPDGKVVMEIDAEKSEVNYIDGLPISITGTANSTSTDLTSVRAPAFDTTMAQTTVSAADGETIVLGGLIQKTDENVQRKVPYLGDIPVLGNLFKYHFERSRRRELLIVLTPHVIRGAEDAERIKRIESARMHWCLQAVREIHNDDGLTSASEAGEVIYPHENPWGTSEGAAGGAGGKLPHVPGTLAPPATLPSPVPGGDRTAPESVPLQPAPLIRQADPPALGDPQSRNRRPAGPEAGWATPVGYDQSFPGDPSSRDATRARANPNGPADRPWTN
jgi:general secretion pathway protein D